MEDRVFYLINESDDSTVLFREYAIIRSKKNNPVFIIEGKDDSKFYAGVIGSYFSGGWEILSTGGKNKLLELRSMIRNHPRYQNDNVAFLADKDFDETKPEHDLYITPTYSIENIYCQPETFSMILNGECGLSDHLICNREEIKATLTSEYKKLQAEFHKNRKILFLNAVYFYAKNAIPESKISLNDIAKIEVKIIKSKLHIKVNKKKKYQDFSKNKKEIYNFLKSHERWDLISKNPSFYFRGKQEILFLREAIKELNPGGFLSEIIKAKYQKNIKLDNPCMSDHIISTAAQYVRRPNCLISFMTSIKAAFEKPKQAVF